MPDLVKRRWGLAKQSDAIPALDWLPRFAAPSPSTVPLALDMTMLPRTSSASSAMGGPQSSPTADPISTAVRPSSASTSAASSNDTRSAATAFAPGAEAAQSPYTAIRHAASQPIAANTSAFLENTSLPSIEKIPHPPLRHDSLTENHAQPRPHLSTDLHIQTNLAQRSGNERMEHIDTPTILESKADIPLGTAASAPTPTQGPALRNALSSASMASSISPGSVISSPMLAAMTDLTPLPSPLVGGDSPGPWRRAVTAAGRPVSRDSSTTASDGPASAAATGRLSVSPEKKSPEKKKKKGYSSLMSAAVAGSGMQAQTQKNEASHGRNRSISEYVPEALHNTRPRNVTISQVKQDVAPLSEPHLHREEYLADQRGLAYPLPAPAQSTLPTPPPSNRSATESEGEDLRDDDSTSTTDHLTVRHGAKKLLYRPIRPLGHGTFSRVVLATSEPLLTNQAYTPDETALDPKRLVAIKIVAHGPAGGADAGRVALSLRREVEMLRAVRHPCLVHLRAFDFDDGRALLVLGYCAGGDSFELASAHREVLGAAMVRRMFAEVVDAVAYLHKQGIVHRDIKLENILLTLPLPSLRALPNPATHPHPLTTLTDLGLSRRIPPPPAPPLLTTRCGSEDYAAPELLLGQAYDGRATDAWALGVLLYALVEGRLPFDVAAMPASGPGGGKVRSRGRAAHRIARCEWMWCRFGDEEGAWDGGVAGAAEWEGARGCVEGLLRKASRGRWSVAELKEKEWVRGGIAVEGGLKRMDDDDGVEDRVEEEDGVEEGVVGR